MLQAKVSWLLCIERLISKADNVIHFACLVKQACVDLVSDQFVYYRLGCELFVCFWDLHLPSSMRKSFVVFFFDFWLELGWINLISWIQQILKNYLCIVFLPFHGKLWCLFTENNFLCIGYPCIPNFIFFKHRSTLSMDTNSYLSCKVTLSTDNVTLCTLYSSN